MEQTTKRGRIDLSAGGDSWAGFTFGSYGRAREWRIMTPAGETITAPELSNLRARDHDLTFLQSRSAELAAKLAGASMAFSPDEAQLLRVALQLMLRELPVQLCRRDARVTPAALVRLAG
jgi:hypothetical protein